jgi:hypothetical protein
MSESVDALAVAIAIPAAFSGLTSGRRRVRAGHANPIL